MRIEKINIHRSDRIEYSVLIAQETPKADCVIFIPTYLPKNVSISDVVYDTSKIVKSKKWKKYWQS